MGVGATLQALGGLPIVAASPVAEWGELWRSGFRRRSTWAQLLGSMCDLPGPGIEPMSPVLQG